MWYLQWRVMVGLNERITLTFFLVGHSKNAGLGGGWGG